jgi:hypothetical protein
MSADAPQLDLLLVRILRKALILLQDLVQLGNLMPTERKCCPAGTSCVLEYVAANTCTVDPSSQSCPDLAPVATASSTGPKVHLPVVIGVAAALSALTVTAAALLALRHRRKQQRKHLAPVPTQLRGGGAAASGALPAGAGIHLGAGNGEVKAAGHHERGGGSPSGAVVTWGQPAPAQMSGPASGRASDTGSGATQDSTSLSGSGSEQLGSALSADAGAEAAPEQVYNPLFGATLMSMPSSDLVGSRRPSGGHNAVGHAVSAMDADRDLERAGSHALSLPSMPSLFATMVGRLQPRGGTGAVGPDSPPDELVLPPAQPGGRGVQDAAAAAVVKRGIGRKG